MKHRPPLAIATALVLALALAACGTVADVGDGATAEIAPSVTFGQPDGDAHPWVVTLLFVQNGVGYYACSGTLLSETLVLTAGHCVEEAGNANDVTYVRNTADALEGRDQYPNDAAGTAAWLDAEWTIAASTTAHPLYADYAAFPQTYDVGVVELSAPIAVGTYGVLPPIGLLEELLTGKNHRDRWFTAVGYGMQGVVPAFLQDDYERYVGTTTLINVNSAFTGDDQSAAFTNNPGRGNGSGGTCYGDSGGPLFVKDTNVIGAIVSFGFTPCIGVDYQFRMDTALAQDFVKGFLVD